MSRQPAGPATPPAMALAEEMARLDAALGGPRPPAAPDPGGPAGRPRRRGLARAGRLAVTLAAVGLVAAWATTTFRGSCADTCGTPAAPEGTAALAAASAGASPGAATGAAAGAAATGSAAGHHHAPPAGATATATPSAGAGTAGPAPAAQRGDHGFRLNVPLPRAGFALTDTSGRRYDFAANTRGRVTLLYFGYTNCPDQCPTMLGVIATALREVPPAVRAKVTVVVVSTDPARDTPAVMRAYLDQFDRTFVGLTGTQAAVTRAQQAAQIPVSRPTPETTRANPGSTAHGGGALAYAPDDYAHLTYPAGTTVEDLRQDLPTLVAATPHA
jgi:protein SCO1/2